jgi:CRP-like cAMP-binding protein
MQSILKFCKGLPEVTFEPGQTLLGEQERGGVLYVLIEGGVEVVKGNIVVRQIAEPGAIFGELAVLLDVPHTASVRALTRCRLYRVQEANEFLRGNQELTFLLAQLLAQRLSSITGYLMDLKAQYQDHTDHLGMVDEVLETLVHQQDEPFEAGSDRDPDTML